MQNATVSPLKKLRYSTLQRYAALVSIVAFMSACVGPTVFDPAPAPRFSQSLVKRIVLADVARDKNVMENTGAFVAALERSLRQQFSSSQFASDLVYERDMSAKGYGDKNGNRVFLVRYRIIDNKEAIEHNTGVFVLMVTLGVLILPLLFAGLPYYNHDDISMTVDMKVYDVTKAPIVKMKDTTAEEMLNIYDTSELAALAKRTYQLKVSGSKGNGSLSAEEKIAWSREMAADLARQLLTQSSKDIQSILARQ